MNDLFRSYLPNYEVLKCNCESFSCWQTMADIYTQSPPSSTTITEHPTALFQYHILSKNDPESFVLSDCEHSSQVNCSSPCITYFEVVIFSRLYGGCPRVKLHHLFFNMITSTNHATKILQTLHKKLIRNSLKYHYFLRFYNRRKMFVNTVMKIGCLLFLWAENFKEQLNSVFLSFHVIYSLT